MVSRRVITRKSGSGESSRAAPLPRPSAPQGSPILVATSNLVRNLVLPRLATFDGISLAGIANSPENALKMLIQEHPDAIIIDSDFGGPLEGLDTARLMQKTRSQTAIVMLVPELDLDDHFSEARRFGSSWSYIKKTTATRENLLEIALKSSVRGVQWIEPKLRRPLADLWRIAAGARDLDARLAAEASVPVTTSLGRKSMNNAVDPTIELNSEKGPVDDEQVEKAFDVDPEDKYDDEIAPGIDLKSTNDPVSDGFDVTSVSIGRGGVGHDVKKVRRTG